MKKAFVFVWFCIRILLTSIFFFVPLVLGAFLMLFNKTVGMGVLVPCDKAMAALIYGKRYRTISGICGEKKLNGRAGYTLIANFINYLAELFGDEPLHCEREYAAEAGQ